jgi:hypothetical protein
MFNPGGVFSFILKHSLTEILIRRLTVFELLLLHWSMLPRLIRHTSICYSMCAIAGDPHVSCRRNLGKFSPKSFSSNYLITYYYSFIK